MVTILRDIDFMTVKDSDDFFLRNLAKICFVVDPRCFEGHGVVRQEMNILEHNDGFRTQIIKFEFRKIKDDKWVEKEYNGEKVDTISFVSPPMRSKGLCYFRQVAKSCSGDLLVLKIRLTYCRNEVFNFHPSMIKLTHPNAMKTVNDPYGVREFIKALPQFDIQDIMLLDKNCATPQVGGVIGKLLFGSIVDSVEHIAEQINPLLNKFDSLGKDAGETIGSLEEAINNAKENLSIDKLTNSIFRAASLVAAVVTAINCCFNRDRQSVMPFVASLACVTVFAKDSVANILSFCSSNLSGEPTFQDGNENVISGALSCLYGMIFPKGKEPSDCFRNLVMEFPKLNVGFQTILEWVMKVLNKFLNLFDRENLPKWFSYIDTMDSKVSRVIASIDNFEKEVCDDGLPTNYSSYLTLKEHISEVENIVSKMPKNQKTLGLLSACNSRLMWMNKALDKFRNANFRRGHRREPVVLTICSGPKKGKTSNVDQIIRSLCTRNMPYELEHLKTMPGDMVYHYNAMQDHVDGYRNQPFVVLDEAFSAMSGPGVATEELSFLLNAISCTNYNMKMAGLEDKGNTYFTSDFVLLTTNDKNFNFDGMRCSDAIKRRLQLVVVPVPKEEIRMEKERTTLWDTEIDFSKLPLGVCGVGDIDANLFDWHEYNAFTHNFTGRVYQYHEMIDMLTQKWELNDKIHNQRLLRHEKECESVVPQSGLLKNTFDEITHIDYGGEKYSIMDIVFNYDQTKLDLYVEMTVDFLIPPVHETTIACRLMYLCTYLNRTYPDENTSNKNCIAAAIKRHRGGFFELLFHRCENEWVNHGVKYVRGKDLQEWHRLDIRRHDFHSMCAELRRILCSKDTYRVAFGKVIDFFDQYKGLIATAILMYKTVGWFNNDKIPPPAEVPIIEEAQSSLYDAKPVLTNRRIPRLKLKSPLEPQMGSCLDNESYDLARKNSIHNQWMLSDGEMYFGTVTQVKGFSVIMPNHFSVLLYNKYEEKGEEFLETELRLERTSNNSTISKKIKVGEILSTLTTTDNSLNFDLCMFRLPDRFQPSSNIVDKFISLSSFEKLMNLDVALWVKRGDKVGLQVSYAKGHVTNDVTMADVKKGLNGYVVKRMIRTNMATENGDCGSLLYLLNPREKGKIIGMHVAGNTVHSFAFASLITKDFIEELLENENLDSFNPEDSLVPDIQCGQYEEDIAQNQLLVLGKKEKIFQVPVSQFVKSPLFGLFGKSLYKPAHLRDFLIDGEKFKIIPNMYVNHCRNDTIPPSGWDICLSFEFSDMESVMVNKNNRRLLTFEEGILGVEDLNPIPRNTSPGYTYNIKYKTKGYKGKQLFFGKDEDYDLDNDMCEILRKDVDEIITNAKSSIRMQHLVQDFKKDETRKNAKVDSGATRLISGIDLPLNLVTRMYFGAFMREFMINNLSIGHAVGVNPFKDWHLIANELTEFDGIARQTGIKCHGAGDYKCFDGTHSSGILASLIGFINGWYNDSEDNQRVRKVLWYEVYDSIHVDPDGILYECLGTLPSGHTMTTIVNCIVNRVAFRYCFYRANDNSLSHAMNFKSFVKLFVLGDDNKFAIHPVYCKVFNYKTIQLYMKELGYVFTDSQKNVELSDLGELVETDFLKRNFVFNKELNKFVGALELDHLLQICYWVQRKGNKVDLTMQCVDNVVMELSLHGRKVFEQWFPKIIKACSETMSERPRFVDYKTTLEFVTSRDDPFSKIRQDF